MKYTDLSNHGKFGFHLRALRDAGLVGFDLSTKGLCLTERGQLLAEILLDTRFLIAREGLDLVYEPERYVRRLRFGDHAVLFYNTKEGKHRITLPFLLGGLVKGEAVAYIVLEDKLDSESQELKRYGININRFPKGAFTMMSAEDWYFRKGKAQGETIIGNWQKLLNEKQNAGFQGLYVAGDMDIFFDTGKTEELMRYESMLGKQFDFNMCALCLYDSNRFQDNEEQLIQLNQYHGHSIFQDIFVNTKNILIVDDDKTVLESLRIILQSKGYSVDTAETGREGIEKSKARLYHLAVLNLKLPDMNGAKLLVTLHKNLPEMVKIIITGFSPDKAGEFLNLGADTYITKPVHPEELLKVVKEKLREREEATLIGAVA